VAQAYRFRLPYPNEVFDTLHGLIRDEPRTVLDIGTGTGDLARPLTARVERVDAVDPSPAMLAEGRALPGGDAPNLMWIEGRAEDAPLSPPYALVTAGESVHWMNWDVLFPRLAAALTPEGSLAMVYRNELPPPWQDELMTLIRETSTMENYQDYDLIDLLQRRGLLEVAGNATTATQRTEQRVDDYVHSFFSRASLSPRAIGPARASDFATRLRALLEPWVIEDTVTLEWAPQMTWGRPLAL
jgi:trans-aconitate methyltransferase